MCSRLAITLSSRHDRTGSQAPVEEVEELPETNRGAGGFGSTGVKTAPVDLSSGDAPEAKRVCTGSEATEEAAEKTQMSLPPVAEVETLLPAAQMLVFLNEVMAMDMDWASSPFQDASQARKMVRRHFSASPPLFPQATAHDDHVRRDPLPYHMSLIYIAGLSALLPG